MQSPKARERYPKATMIELGSRAMDNCKTGVSTAYNFLEEFAVACKRHHSITCSILHVHTSECINPPWTRLASSRFSVRAFSLDH